jgi:hypothetical protein
MFCEAVARMIVRDHPDIATVERVERTGDLFRTALASPQRLSTAIRALEKFL